MMKFKWLIWSFISALTILFLVSCGPSAKDKDNQEITVEETSFQSLGAYKGIIKIDGDEYIKFLSYYGTFCVPKATKEIKASFIDNDGEYRGSVLVDSIAIKGDRIEIWHRNTMVFNK